MSSMKKSNSPEKVGKLITPVKLKRYQSIRDHSFFRIEEIEEGTSFWNLVEGGLIEPPVKPERPEWMTALHRGDTTLKPFESIHFDL